MDNKALQDVIGKIPGLKYKYLGSYPADYVPPLRESSFAIINTDRSDRLGSHWILIARKGNVFFYGDSLGQSLEMYRDIVIDNHSKFVTLVSSQIQKTSSLCGFYCIYFAWAVFNGLKSVPLSFNDLDLLRFIYKFV